MRFLVALLIASLFVDKADSEFSSIPRHHLYPGDSYSTGVRSQKYSPLALRDEKNWITSYELVENNSDLVHSL